MGDSVAESLSAAWDASESEMEDDGLQDEREPADTGADQPEEPARSGVDTRGHGEPADRQSRDSGDGSELPDAAQPVPAGGEAGDKNQKPPVGLPPEAREVWADTPKAMRDAVYRREVDFAKGIQHYAENAKRAHEMDAALAPYSQYLAMNGGPAAALHALLQTGSSLQMGTPAQKATAVANIIQQFGVDIETLDQLLSGNTPKAGQDDRLEQLLEQRLQPVQQYIARLQQGQQYEQQQQAARISQEIEQFAQDPQREFYNDVRMDMADILDMAANRGVEMSLAEAYERACRLDPRISKIQDARQAGKSVESKRRAAASIRGLPSDPGQAAEPGSLRASLEAAWDEHGRL